jgi:hypothetical protein
VRFEPYDDLAGRRNLILDGSPTAGTALTVTHWPGYPPPEEIAADLSAQMAFRLLEHPEAMPSGVELVSNNHFDQDGLVSIFAVTAPEAATARRARLEDAASAGDFATYRDRDAARLSMAISAVAAGADPSLPALPEPYPQRTAVLYTEALGRLAAWCDRPALVRHLWAEEDDSLTRSDAAFEAGAATVAERPDVDLAVVAVAAGAPDAGGHRFGGDWVGGLHPMAVFARTDRHVVATVRARRYVVEQRYETWVQLRSRPLRLRRDLVPLAARLQDEETGDGRWSATAVGGLTPRLTSGEGESSLPPARVVAVLADHLATAPPAWDPFRAGAPALAH